MKDNLSFILYPLSDKGQSLSLFILKLSFYPSIILILGFILLSLRIKDKTKFCQGYPYP